jgi:hypothetical protein
LVKEDDDSSEQEKKTKTKRNGELNRFHVLFFFKGLNKKWGNVEGGFSRLFDDELFRIKLL